jgi:hypothetical protein
MEYSVDIVIDLPRDRVIELFNSEENLYKWQEGLQGIEHVTDVQGEVGSKMRMAYLQGGRSMEIVETILEKTFPIPSRRRTRAKGSGTRSERPLLKSALDTPAGSMRISFNLAD